MFFGVESYSRFMDSSHDAAKVDGRAITVQEVDNVVRDQTERMRQMLGNNYDPRMFEGAAARQSVLDQLILQRVVADATARKNLTVSNEQLRQAIEAIPAIAQLRGPDGKLDPAKRYSHLGVGTPGTVLGLQEMHRRYGKLPWRSVAQPAVDLASDGIVVTDELVYGLALQRDGLTLDAPTARSLFKPGGVVYRPGERLRQPDLAWSLAQVRDHGAQAFYGGELGRRVVAGVQAGEGPGEAADRDRDEAERKG